MFAFAPRPADDELPGSWLHRMAIHQGISAKVLIGDLAGDIDWRMERDAQQYLKKGTGVPAATLKAMTLSEIVPGSERGWFARSASLFPGCHAFCPACAADDVPRHGHLIQRASDAGLWRILCRRHGCFLDGVDSIVQVTPRQGRGGVETSGDIKPGLGPIVGSSLFRSFEDAAEAAQRGDDPGAGWLVRRPTDFLAIARELAAIVMVRGNRRTAMAAMLGWAAPAPGVATAQNVDLGWLDAMSAFLRVRALAAVAFLLSTRSLRSRTDVMGWQPGRGDPWFKICLEHCPWAVAASAWFPREKDFVLSRAELWPGPLRDVVRRELQNEPFLLLVGDKVAWSRPAPVDPYIAPGV